MMKRFLQLFLLIVSANIYCQKPPLDPSVYDRWQSLDRAVISDNGDWVVYSVKPQEGDSWMVIYNPSTEKADTVSRGVNPSFSKDSGYLVYQVAPTFSESQRAKRKKLKDEQAPKMALGIRNLETNEVITIPRVKSFAIPESGSLWMAYLLEKKLPEKADTSRSENGHNGNVTKGEKSKKKAESKGSDLVILNPVSNIEFRLQDVTDYVVAAEGQSISLVRSIPDTASTDSSVVIVFDSQTQRMAEVFAAKGEVKKISSDRSGHLTSFIYSPDTSKIKVYDLWLSREFAKAEKVIDRSNSSMPHGWAVSETSDMTFSDDGTRLYFGTAEVPVKEPPDTLLDEEKYKLDIWSWSDDLLQPMQKKQLDQELKRSYPAVYNINKDRMLQLADTTIYSVRIDTKANHPFVLGNSDLNYRKSMSWEGRNYEDYYIINLETGLKSQILKHHPSQVYLSPGGKYLISWNPEKLEWVVMSVTGEVKKTISTPGKLPLYDEQNDIPDDPSPYGIAGWTDNDNNVLVYDKFDIWSFKIEGKENPVNLTNGYGRANNIRFRYLKLDKEERFISPKDPCYLSAFNYETKEAGFYLVRFLKIEDPVRLYYEEAAFPGGILKARDSDKILWRRESFNISPELFFSDLNFRSINKVAATNPDQNRYNWLTAELIEWTSFDNQKLQGILYKPEDFDPAKKYPMVVYFYERSSDGLYSYFPPAPSASIINRSFAVSNGYLLFVPDIVYRTGYPGQSCYDAVVSGTLSLFEKYPFIDKDRIGLDGQSWGGYQVAWLVTRTNLFKCAFAGAPVSDMISAYGGIRWESGMSRMFQYEHTQSRIGGTLWEKPLQFIENSPVFFVPRINTPLLIMHNDADGAVPWYQGIEFITALRRLNKPAWLLSYNDEAHNLVKRANRKDLSIRKMQFFDHFLKEAPMPYWMKYGISQKEKGKIDGYQMVE
jgi:dipeptidyl aminopeptidase/acylaminoacyl peptidase